MKYVIFGESHGPAIGVVLEDPPPGLDLDPAAFRADLDRRAPRGATSTARKEKDEFQFLSGVFEGRTTGTPLCIVIPNTDAHSKDYEALRTHPRPGHADYTASVRYEGCQDYRGGGHFSGRLTAALVLAGTVAKLALKPCGVSVSAAVSNVAGIPDPTPEQAEAAILAAKAEGDSVGGAIRCTVSGLPAGAGSPDLGRNVEGIFAQHLYAVPAVKAVSFGAGFGFAALRGSEANDPFYWEGDGVRTRTNHSGGVNGGITNGMPLELEVALRPTPSIARPQETVDLATGEPYTLAVTGRHDPCIVLRAVPVVEAAAALAACELLGL